MTSSADQSGTVVFTFAGRSIEAKQGESLASALLVAGECQLGIGKDGSPRGAFCGMGVCHDCLVIVDGVASQRACLTTVRMGMSVEPQDSRGLSLGTLSDQVVVPASSAPEEIECLVIGAGPAGLAAALAAARHGVRVVVVDERKAAGGQYFKQSLTDAAPRDRQMAEGSRLIAEVREAGVELRNETMVWGAFRSGTQIEITTIRQRVTQVLLPRSLVLATGAYEAPPLVPGWTLPGVMTTGAVQTYLRSYGTFPRTPVLIAGNGPLNFQVALELAQAGAEVVGIVEAAPPPWMRPQAAISLLRADRTLALEGLSILGKIAARGIPVHWNHRLVNVQGQDRAELAHVAPYGQAEPVKVISAGIIAHGDGFLPASELPRLLGCLHEMKPGHPVPVVRRDDDGATSQGDVFVVGEAGGFGGAHIAQAQGKRAGLAVARLAGHKVENDPATMRQLVRHRRFQTALWTLFSAEPQHEAVPDTTILCRCEALSIATLKTVIEDHDVRDVATLKRLSRAGMGRCQARYCGHRLQHLLHEMPKDEMQFFAPQVPVRPVPIAALAVEKPEWAGHKRSLLPMRNALPQPPLPVTEAETVVIGAGIAGLSTALFLAEAGHDVVVLDRSFPNASASGGNAGSLHAQLLSFDFGVKAEAGGSPALKTLPLQRDSIALWQELQRRSALDFELKITGGLMVAESEKDLRFLHDKTRFERENGVPCEVIGANDLRNLEPALHEGFLGAAYCPIEGKINPLVATQGILSLAKAAGARIITHCQVMAIEKQGAVFSVHTSRGVIRCANIVNAAGAFAAQIGEMAGLSVPVFGAPLQMIVTEPAKPLVTRLIAHADRHLTLKQAGNGSFVIGGGWTAGLDRVHQHPRPLRDSIEGNLWIAQHVVPDLRKIMVLRSWAAMNINIDGAPIIGEHPSLSGFFNAVTSNGYTLGPMMGHLTSSLVQRRDAGRDLAPFTIARFS